VATEIYTNVTTSFLLVLWSVTQGDRKVGEKNSWSFLGFFQRHKYTSPEVIATKLEVSRRLRLDKVVSNYITDDISQRNLPSQQLFYANILSY